MAVGLRLGGRRLGRSLALPNLAYRSHSRLLRNPMAVSLTHLLGYPTAATGGGRYLFNRLLEAGRWLDARPNRA